MATNNNEPNTGGRPTFLSSTSKEQGIQLRELLKLHLSWNNMKRPMEKGFEYNAYGMIYIDY